MSFAQGHALLVGVGSYAHAASRNVPSTVADAEAVAAVLRDPRSCGYPAAQVTLLAEAAATRAGLLAALDALAARAGADDTVLVFYAGHGEEGDDGYELTTHDTRFEDERVVAGSGLRASELIARLRAIRAKRLLLLVNACHSGQLAPVLGAGAAPPTGTPLPSQVSASLLGTGEGRVIISACREHQYAFVGPGPLTLFAQALVDGLRGTGVSSSSGYISVFDLYTHLYFALAEAVPRDVPPVVRQQYGEKQEPELTILKGVGPFAVALWRGAPVLGMFDAGASPPAGTAVREIERADALALLRRIEQRAGEHAQVGAVVGGDLHGPVNVTKQVRTTTVHGDYAEGNMDKRSGPFVSGDQINFSGNVSGAILNIKSRLTNVTQQIGAVSQGDPPAKERLALLIEQLGATLQQAPADRADEAEAVAEIARQAVEQATKPQPNATLVQISAAGLEQAAQHLAAVLPRVPRLAAEIAKILRSGRVDH